LHHYGSAKNIYINNKLVVYNLNNGMA